MNLLHCQARFGAEEKYAEALKQQRRPNSFQWPYCGHGYWVPELRDVSVTGI